MKTRYPHACFRCRTKINVSETPKQLDVFNGTHEDAYKAGWKRFVWKHSPRDMNPTFWLCAEHAGKPYEDSEER